MSFLSECPQCSVMRAKDYPCPNCNFIEAGSAAADVAPAADTILEFNRRLAVNKRNNGIYMLLSMALGVVGTLTAGMWMLVIFGGSLMAFLLVGVLSVASAALSFVLFDANKRYSRNLHCPACEVRLDQMGRVGDQCPACLAQIRDTHSVDTVDQQEQEMQAV